MLHWWLGLSLTIPKVKYKDLWGKYRIKDSAFWNASIVDTADEWGYEQTGLMYLQHIVFGVSRKASKYTVVENAMTAKS